MTTTLFNLILFAPAGEQSGATTLIFFGQMAAIIAIFYYFFVRPNAQKEKQHRERLSKLKKGDRVVTVGGIIGEIVHIKDDDVTVKSGESRVIVQRGRIAEVAFRVGGLGLGVEGFQVRRHSGGQGAGKQREDGQCRQPLRGAVWTARASFP